MRRRRIVSGHGVVPTMTIGVIIVALAIAVALYTGLAALRFVPSLNLSNPALANIAPVIGPAPPRLARRVVLVMIDGLRLDTSYGRPWLDQLRAAGIDAEAHSHFPSMSMPNYVSIATGVEPAWSGVRANDDAPWMVRLDSMMARARAAGMRVGYASATSDALPRMFPDELDDGGVAPWQGGLERTVANLLASGNELLLVWISDVDTAGHAFGGDSREYRTAARRVDAKLGVMFADLDLARDAVVVIADHGHIDRGGHGGVEPEAMQVPLILAGAGVRAGATIADAGLVDVAPTVCALLGLPPPGHALGRVLTEALAIAPAAQAAIATADRARHDRLLPDLERQLANSMATAWRVRAWRGGIFLAGLAALVALAAYSNRRGWVLIDRRVAWIAIPAFPLTFYGMMMAFEHWLSPSMLPGTGSIAPKLFLYGSVAALANLAAAWYALAGRDVPRERLAAAAGLVLVGLAVAITPAGLAWTIAGPTMPIELPTPDIMMLPPVTYAGVSCFAVSALLIIIVEYTVFLARASHAAR